MKRCLQTAAALAAAAMIALVPAPHSASAAPGDLSTAAPDSADAGTAKPHPRHGHGGFRTGGPFIFNESAKLFGLSRDELAASLKSGKTLYQLAKEKKGWSEDDYIQKLSEVASAKLDESVKSGKLTADEVSKLKAGLPALIKLSISHAEQFHTKKPAGVNYLKQNES
ncbi:hypothetical protein [Paenibacillus sp. NFR01]|uniref:hypothetical protein n=1 Tax=Paenibacillus sp. NFR01 TaxID=1566279 RepID=UPI0008B39FA4|nr:hypothetical protein [Paenibacillus sp. NFR01]SET35475.1 hypothetical protein SAMN03159358_1434 [Paenibacillus sp. NFR01]